jgi:hypothetical protein
MVTLYSLSMLLLLLLPACRVNSPQDRREVSTNSCCVCISISWSNKHFILKKKKKEEEEAEEGGESQKDEGI